MNLSAINIYPIKSCAGISVPASELESRGLRFDRRWMLVDENGMFLTQRDVPRLTLVSVDVEADHLAVHAPDMPRLAVPFALLSKDRLPVVVWDDHVDAVSVGNEAAEWFSSFLGKRCSLVSMPDDARRLVDTTYARDNNLVSFADGFPLLLISEASLGDLNARLASPIPMSRFRPNLVVEGCDAFAEDGWKAVQIGEIRMHVVKPCARCTITTVDTLTGEKGDEPLRTLATYRSAGNNVLFGQNVLHTQTGMLHVGDEIRLL